MYSDMKSEADEKEKQQNAQYSIDEIDSDLINNQNNPEESLDVEKVKSLKNKFRYNDKEMPFLEHLEQLRKTIINIGFSLLIGFLICFPFGKYILEILLKPAEPFIQTFSNQTNNIGIFLVFQEPTSSIKMILLVTFFGGLF